MSSAVLIVRLVLAAIFVAAGVGKLRDLEGSRKAMHDFGLPLRAAATAGLLLPLAELATAAALVFEPTAVVGGVAALLLLLAFMAGIANALRHGDAPDCHCFGQIHSSPAGRGTLLRNAVFAAMAVFVIAAGPGPAIDSWVGDRTAAELAAVGAGAAALILALLYAQIWLERKQLHLDLGTAQRLAASAPPGIPVGSPAPDFSLPTLRGETVSLQVLLDRGLPILLVFASPSCHSCVELLPQIGRWQQSLSRRLTIALINTGSAEENRPVIEEHGVEDVLLQERYEVIESYRIRSTPSAVIVTTQGKIASNPAESVFGIEPLIRLALRDGADAVAESSVAGPAAPKPGE